MLRRLSVLVRKPTQDREAFSRAWEHHGTLVKHLPGLRAYQQNHVLEQFDRADARSPFRVDGIVELQFDSIEAMQDAFRSEAATPVKADEPHFLGHGTGYVGARPRSHQPAPDGQKLILIGRSEDDANVGEVLERAVERLHGLRSAIRDDVVSVIARPEMAEGPQHADAFVHAYFSSAAEASQAARSLTSHGLTACVTVVRVRTVTVV